MIICKFRTVSCRKYVHLFLMEDISNTKYMLIFKILNKLLILVTNVCHAILHLAHYIIYIIIIIILYNYIYNNNIIYIIFTSFFTH